MADGQAATKIKPTGLDLLREPFPDHLISKLPKETRKQIDERDADKSKMVWNCEVCGGYHHKNAIHLDYVGHAALTDRLLDCDPHWTWRPVVMEGLPNPGTGMWIELTVCGVSRLGYGSADGKKGGDAIKEIIGDALRNAAMRFGAALDLWHKGSLRGPDDEGEDDEAPAAAEEKVAPQPATKANSRELFATLMAGIRNCKSSRELKEWGKAFADDIKKMDPSFQKELKAEYKAELDAHKDHEELENADQ